MAKQIAVGLLAVVFVVAAVEAVAVTESFESLPAGYGYVTSGSIQSGGVSGNYLRCERTVGDPIVRGSTSAAGFSGDLAAYYGTPALRIRYYARDDADTIGEFRGDLEANTGSGRWKKSLAGNLPTTWTEIDETVFVSWSDAEANAVGWVTEGSAATWVDTVTDLKYLQWLAIGSGGGTRHLGLDELSIDGTYSAVEDFDTMPSGWSFVTSGAVVPGGNPGNYLQVTRNVSEPIARGSTAHAGFVGNFESQYGYNSLRLSVDAKDESGTLTTLWFFLGSNGGAGSWKKNLGTIPNDWDTLEELIDTNWTDGQAAANGWVTEGTVASWADTLEDVYRILLLSDKSGGGTHILGIDNLEVGVFIPTPAPASAVLVAIGLAVLAVRRRR